MITDIGDGQVDDGGVPLICATEFTPCCRTIPNRHGQWYYPNGTAVPIFIANYYFYRDRCDFCAVNNTLGGARLNRRNNGMTLTPSYMTGIYSCVIPDANGVNQSLHVGLYTSENNSKYNNYYYVQLVLCIIYAL